MTTNCSLNYKFSTGKSFSEALIIGSTNPQSFVILWLVDVRINTSDEDLPVHENCKVRTQCLLKSFLSLFFYLHSEQFMYTTCFELAIFMYWTHNSMNNLLSYFGLVDVGISDSEKKLPVHLPILLA